LMQATPEELMESDEVGAKIADSIIEYFADEDNRAIIDRLRAAGLQFESEQKELQSDALAGKNVVVSGKFYDHTRDELKELIEAHGGKNQSGVSSNTDFIVAGDNMGPAKLQKAQKLGVTILSEREFVEMIGGAGSTATVSEKPAEIDDKMNDKPLQGSLF
ncbi:MAG: NAD-dependent DNA ligase LigA, partial [Alistipes sp.]|nr:NAD-dependent DNA ligase LigA [Alistipes sp.]